MAQTHTNRGGSSGGPEGDKVGPCPQEIATARKLEAEYLKLHEGKLSKKQKQIPVEERFSQLIHQQSLDINLELVSKLELPSCKTCLGDKKKLLMELVEIYQKKQQCPEFWKKEELVPLMKNIIVYGK